MHPNRVRWAYHLTWIGFLLIILVAHLRWGTGLTSLIRFGDQWSGHRVPELASVPFAQLAHNAGYDGQFYAQIAVHPRLHDASLADAMDSVHYRARRILMPIVAHLLGGGNPWWILQVYAAINVCCWFCLAWQLANWLPPQSWKNFGRWFFCVASAGVLASVRGALTDLPSLCLLLAALQAWEKNRLTGAACFLAAVGLTRETMLLGSAFAVQRARPWLRTMLLLGVAFGPIVLWTFYLHRQFPAGDRSSDNFSWPFVTIVQSSIEAFERLFHGPGDNGRYLFRLAAVVGLAVQVGTLLRAPRPDQPLWRMALPFLLLLPLLGPPVWYGYWAVCRTVLPVTLAFNVLLPDRRGFWPLLLAANLPTTLHAIFRLVF